MFKNPTFNLAFWPLFTIYIFSYICEFILSLVLPDYISIAISRNTILQLLPILYYPMKTAGLHCAIWLILLNAFHIRDDSFKNYLKIFSFLTLLELFLQSLYPNIFREIYYSLLSSLGLIPFQHQFFAITYQISVLATFTGLSYLFVRYHLYRSSSIKIIPKEQKKWISINLFIIVFLFFYLSQILLIFYRSLFSQTNCQNFRNNLPTEELLQNAFESLSIPLQILYGNGLLLLQNTILLLPLLLALRPIYKNSANIDLKKNFMVIFYFTIIYIVIAILIRSIFSEAFCTHFHISFTIQTLLLLQNFLAGFLTIICLKVFSFSIKTY